MEEEAPQQTYTHGESAARRSQAEVEAMTADDLLFALDLLFQGVLKWYSQARVAANELGATERLRRLATKHEEASLARGLAEDAAHLAEVVPVYEQRASQYLTQWLRYWAALEARVARQGEYQ